MYRIVAVILFCSIYCVQSETPIQTKCYNAPLSKTSRKQFSTCFNDVVDAHLNGPVPGKCSNISEVGEYMKKYFINVERDCKLNFTTAMSTSTDRFLQFVNHSLCNRHFKDFYSDIACVEKLESNMSNCVFDKLGFFNITKEHSSWIRKIKLDYSNRNCQNAKHIRACTLTVLNSCKNSTCEYVASLFDFPYQNCNSTFVNKPLTRPEKAEPIHTSKLSKSALAAVIICPLIAVAVLGVLFVKFRHRVDCHKVNGLTHGNQ